MNLKDRSFRGVRGYEVERYVRYVFSRRPFAPEALPLPGDKLRQLALEIRGAEHPPAIFVQGMLPRAGTVYVGEILRLHPDVYAYPAHIWEFPLLQRSGDILALQREFLRSHEQNRGKIGGSTFLTLTGAAFIAYLYAHVPPGKRLLLKVPSVEYLAYFWHLYPHEQLLLLIRDGRDLVDSTVRTWPVILFPFAARRWARAARAVLAFDDRHRQRTGGYCLARYEDAVADPAAFARQACLHLDLDPKRFPYNRLKNLQVRGSSQLRENGEVVWEPKQRPHDFRPTGRWETWSRVRRWQFRRLAGDELIALEYARDACW